MRNSVFAGDDGMLIIYLLLPGSIGLMKQNPLAAIAPGYATAALAAVASGLATVPAFLIFWIGGAVLTLLFSCLAWRVSATEGALDVEADVEMLEIACARWEADRRMDSARATAGAAMRRADRMR